MYYFPCTPLVAVLSSASGSNYKIIARIRIVVVEDSPSFDDVLGFSHFCGPPLQPYISAVGFYSKVEK